MNLAVGSTYLVRSGSGGSCISFFLGWSCISSVGQQIGLVGLVGMSVGYGSSRSFAHFSLFCAVNCAVLETMAGSARSFLDSGLFCGVPVIVVVMNLV